MELRANPEFGLQNNKQRALVGHQRPQVLPLSFIPDLRATNPLCPQADESVRDGVPEIHEHSLSAVDAEYQALGVPGVQSLHSQHPD